MHKTRAAEYLTAGQLQFMFSEIDKQENGCGTASSYENFDYYWVYEHIDNWVEPKLFIYNKIDILDEN